MQIKGISVSIVPEGTLVSVTALLAGREELAGEDIANILAIAQEAQAGEVNGDTVRAHMAVEHAKDEAAPTSRRRGAAAPAEAEATPSRRRRGTAGEAAPASAEPASSTGSASEAPASRRRRGSAAAEPAAEAAPARRRHTAEPPKEEGISDADLAKAASHTATVCGPNAVTAYIEEFGAAVVSEIKQAERQEFLDGLKAMENE